MEAFQCIKTRRSRRKFLAKDIPAEIIEKIIDAGRCAPSSENSQPWQFFIVKNRDLINKFSQINHKYNKDAILSCNLIIVICVDMEKSPISFVEDGVLASQNMALIIHDLGLGCVYLSGHKFNDIRKEEDIQKLFNIQRKFKPISLLLVGYPDPKEKLDNKILRDSKELIEYR
ncbi:MAG: nitroreductase family protein [Patescibacteria group bacterium]|nr:nitroreductase family protein [Patescibacteria group bacterium]